MDTDEQEVIAWNVFEGKRGMSPSTHSLLREELDVGVLYSCSPNGQPQNASGWVAFLNDGRYLTMSPAVTREGLIATLQSMASPQTD